VRVVHERTWGGRLFQTVFCGWILLVLLNEIIIMIIAVICLFIQVFIPLLVIVNNILEFSTVSHLQWLSSVCANIIGLSSPYFALQSMIFMSLQSWVCLSMSKRLTVEFVFILFYCSWVYWYNSNVVWYWRSSRTQLQNWHQVIFKGELNPENNMA